MLQKLLLKDGSDPVANQIYIQDADCQSKISCHVRDATIRSPMASPATWHSDIRRPNVTSFEQVAVLGPSIVEAESNGRSFTTWKCV
jgi:hypothetical protein